MHNFVSIHNYLKVVRPLHKDLPKFCLRANEITFSEHQWTGQMKSPHNFDLQYFSQDSLAQKFRILWFHLPCRIYVQYQGKWNHLTGHLKSMIFMIFCTKYACEKIQLTGFYVEDIFRNWLGISEEKSPLRRKNVKKHPDEPFDMRVSIWQESMIGFREGVSTNLWIFDALL